MSEFNEDWVQNCAAQIVKRHVHAALQSHAQAGKPVPPPTREVLVEMMKHARAGVIAECYRRREMGLSDPVVPKAGLVSYVPQDMKAQLVAHSVEEKFTKPSDSAADIIAGDDAVTDIKSVATLCDEMESAGIDGQQKLRLPEPLVSSTDDDNVQAQERQVVLYTGPGSDTIGDHEDVGEQVAGIVEEEEPGETEEVAVISATVRQILPEHRKLFIEGESVDTAILARDEMLVHSDDRSLVIAVTASSDHSMEVSGLQHEKPVTDLVYDRVMPRDNYFVMSDPALNDPLTAAFRRWRARADIALLFGDHRLRTALSTMREYVRPVWHEGRVVAIALLTSTGAIFPYRAAIDMKLHPLGVDAHGHSHQLLEDSARLVIKTYPRMTDGFNYVRRRVPRDDMVIVMVPCGRLIVPVGPVSLRLTVVGWAIDIVLPPNAAGAPLLSVDDGTVVGQVGDTMSDDRITDGYTSVLTSWVPQVDTGLTGYGRCDRCGFTVNRDGHITRCVVVMASDAKRKALYRRRAWVGDTVFMRMVRYMILQSDTPMKNHTIRSAELCSAKAQRLLYTLYQGDKWEVLGSNDHAYSTAFEATLVDDVELVTFVLDWLGAELGVDSLIDPTAFMPTTSELEAASGGGAESSGDV